MIFKEALIKPSKKRKLSRASFFACTLFRFLFQDLHELFSRDGFLFIEVLC